MPDKKNAPDRQTYTYLGPGDEIGIADRDEPEHTRLYRRFAPVELTEAELRYFEANGHQFEGRGLSVAGAAIPGMPPPFVAPPAAPAGVTPAAPTSAAVPPETIPHPVVAAVPAAAPGPEDTAEEERRSRRTRE